MATPSQWSRTPAGPRLTEPEPPGENLRGTFAGSVALHGLLLAAIVGGSYLFHRTHESWGENAATAGAIQASVVSALPLPPRQKTLDTGVLTSDRPSPAPTPAKERAEPPPKPDEVPIPVKHPPKPPRVAERPAPEPPRHPQPTPPQPRKATTGEIAGTRIPQATMQLRNGTASVAVEDRSFGARYAYYINIVNRTVAQNWFTQEADPRTSEGRRTAIVFDINRDGTPSNVRIESRSGSPSLDQSALHAVQRVEGFGPLPGGADHITVEYFFDYRQQ